MTDPTTEDYEFYPREADIVEQAEELEKWQEKKKQVLAEYLKQKRNDEQYRLSEKQRERERRWGYFRKTVIAILIVAAIGVGIFFAVRSYHRSVDLAQARAQARTQVWVDNCQKAGGRVVGNTANTYETFCAFPNGSELPRNYDKATS